ncbi:hypothetical protein CDAR_303531 [Caerostris darwini]|uniref:Uncharacterized protein n=1 Tax=Caerostris darwini TaxID=1538125 RepID=A0AAV4WV11_9ARAC|nr:hypothetical protein CDAR_303531 [Caerostris darwini]
MLFMPRALFQTVRKMDDDERWVMDGEEEAFLLEALTPLVRRGAQSNQRSVVNETALFQKRRSSAHYLRVASIFSGSYSTQICSSAKVRTC